VEGSDEWVVEIENRVVTIFEVAVIARPVGKGVGKHRGPYGGDADVVDVGKFVNTLLFQL